MQKNYKKIEENQSKATELTDDYKHIILEWATGTGKTLAALKIIEKLVKKTNKPLKWLILCQERNHINNWLEEIKKHKLEHLLEYIQIFCYASCDKYNTGEEYCLILDECHHAISQKRQDCLLNMNVDYCVYLSATLPFLKWIEIKNLIRQQPFYRFKISMIEAIEDKILPVPEIVIIECELADANRNCIYKKGRGRNSKNKFYCSYKDRWKILKEIKNLTTYELNITCTEKEYYSLISTDMDYFYGKNTFKFLALASQRKRFVAECKTKKLNNIINTLELQNSRYVAFTGSIPQANHFKNVIHSKNKQNTELITKFNNLEINNLVAVKMLRESMNLIKIDIGIITQLDSKELSFIQMLGRCFRSDKPLMYILVMNTTKDTEYLTNALKKIKSEWLTKKKLHIEN